MPVVGEAHIIVRAITTNVAKDIKQGFNGVSGSGGKQAEKAGQDLSNRFMKGFNKGGKDTSFLSNFAAGLKEMNPAAEQALESMNQLIMSGYKGSAMAGIFVSSLGALIGGLVALAGAAIGAAASITSVIGLFLSMKVASAVAKMAFNGIGEAVQQATQAQKNQAQEIRNVREELQQLKFDAEEAALSQESAAIALEKAREGLARTSDLPADSRARREAELSYKQAELNYRRATDRNNDLQEELKTGAKARAAAAAKDPYASLTASQKGFAKFLTSLQPIMKTLREAVASGFLPLLQKGLSDLMTSKTFDAVFNGIKNIGAALGQAVKPLTDFLSSAEATGYLNQIFSDMAYVVKQFGPILAKFFGVFMKIMAASGPIVRRLADYILKMLTDFKDFLDLTGDTKLTEFFITAADMAGKFGKIFGNVFNGLIRIAEANFGPGTGGDILLNWLAEATSAFGTFGGQGKSQLVSFFQAVSLNAKKMLDGVGGVITTIIELGADPKVGQFFETIKKATPQIGEILKKANSAMPIIGKILEKIIDIVNQLVDSGAVDNYFNTLLQGVTLVDNILNNKVLSSIQVVTGRIKAFTLGFKKVSDTLQPVFQFLEGSVGSFAEKVGGIQDIFKAVTQGGKATGQGVGYVFDNLGGKIKKTLASYEKYAKAGKGKRNAGNQARDFTGQVLVPSNLGNEKAGNFLKNASKWTRDLVDNSSKFKNGLGRINVQYGKLGVTAKVFQGVAYKGFKAMEESQNQYVKNLGKIGSFLVMHPVLLLIGLLVTAFAALYTTNEEFKKQIDNIFKPALDTLKVAWEQIMIALQPVFVAFKGMVGATGELGGKATGLSLVFMILAQAVSSLVQFLAPLIVSLVQFLAPIVEVLINVFTFLNTNVIAPLIPAILIFTGVIYGLNLAMKAHAAIVALSGRNWMIWLKSQKIVQAVTKIGTAIQAAFNFVMALSPLTWIVIGIVALIAAIIWLATNTTFFADVWAGLSALWQASIDAIGMAFNWVLGIIKSVWDWIVANWPLLLSIILGPIATAAYLIYSNLDAIIGFFQSAFQVIGDIVMNSVNGFVGFFAFLGASIMNMVNSIPGFFVSSFNFIVDFFKNFINGAIGLFEGFVNFILSGVNMIIKALNSLSVKIPDWVPFVGGQTWGLNIPLIPPLSIPRLANGGVVMPSPGGSLVNVAEAGRPEKVVPLDANGLSAGDKAVLAAVQGGNGINITVNGSPGMDVNALAAEVGRKLAFQMRKGAYN
jgi:phage-related protein